MGLFDFAKKKEAPQQQGMRAPVDEVIRLRSQGLSNNQIVQALQRHGFQTHQIFEAFSQADMRVPSAVQGMPGQQQGMRPENGMDLPPPPFGQDIESDTIQGPQSPEEFSQGELGQGGQNIFPEESQPQPGFGGRPEYGSFQPEHDASAKIEEISEAIIEEKWQDLMKDFNKILEWKGLVEQRMAAAEQRLSDLKSAFDTLQKGVLQKVSDYDKSVKDVGSEMKALEQVFQKIIPTLTENVNELSRITKGMKAPEKKKSSL